MKLYLILLGCCLSSGALCQKKAPSAYVKNLMDDTARLSRHIDSLRPKADAAFDEYQKWETLRNKAQKARDQLSVSDSLHYKQRLDSINKVLTFRNRKLKEADARLTPILVDMDSTIGKKNKEIERLADAVNRHQ
jgi:hypothetical protein